MKNYGKGDSAIMKKMSKRTKIAMSIAAFLLIAAGLVYYRPMTLSQLYPALPLDQCTEIRCTYFDFTKRPQGWVDVTIERDSEAFQNLCTLFYNRNYHRAHLNRELKDLLTFGIQKGSAYNTNWYVSFLFDGVELPDGTTEDDVVLRFDYLPDHFDIYFDREFFACQTSKQKAWATEVLNTIQKEIKP